MSIFSIDKQILRRHGRIYQIWVSLKSRDKHRVKKTNNTGKKNPDLHISPKITHHLKKRRSRRVLCLRCSWNQAWRWAGGGDVNGDPGPLGCATGGSPVFMTIRFLPFPFTSKQRQWDSAALSCAVIHRGEQASPSVVQITIAYCTSPGAALCSRYFFL